MKILVTCGPSYEPIDQVRRLTNFSTGRLGITLANALAAQGWEVICFKGEQATCPDPLKVRSSRTFTTNQDLAEQIAALSQTDPINVIFHAAALCDYRVDGVLNSEGRAISSAKIPTRSGKLTLTLAPSVKVLPQLRQWFPRARIVGWKYELAGTQADAFEKAWQQIRECETDGCVLNGAAYGQGFAFCTLEKEVHRLPDLESLVAWLVNWTRLLPRS